MRSKTSLVLPADVTLLSVYPHAHYLGKDDARGRGAARRQHEAAAAHQRAGISTGSRTTATSPQCRCRAARGSRCATPTTTRRRTRPIPAGRRGRSPGGRSPATRWAISGCSCSRAPPDRALLSGPSPNVRHATTCAVRRFASSMRPTMPAERTSLGSSYLEVGRVADAIAELEIAVRQRPDAVQARNFLGGRTPGGRPHGRRRRAASQAAVALAPRDAHLQFNLGKALATGGRAPGRRRSLRAGDRARSGLRAAAPGARRPASSRTAEYARRFRTCSVPSSSLRIQRRPTATSAVRSPRPGASTKRPRISDGRWSSILRTRRRARTSRGCRDAESHYSHRLPAKAGSHTC